MVSGTDGPAAGKVGNLIVAVGLGGRLMRTVSFFGCTLAASTGFGGIPPGGRLGLLSAIKLIQCCQPRIGTGQCQTLFDGEQGVPDKGSLAGPPDEQQMGLTALATLAAVLPITAA